MGLRTQRAFPLLGWARPSFLGQCGGSRAIFYFFGGRFEVGRGGVRLQRALLGAAVVGPKIEKSSSPEFRPFTSILGTPGSSGGRGRSGQSPIPPTFRTLYIFGPLGPIFLVLS